LADVFIIPSKFVYNWFRGVISEYFDNDPDQVKRWRFHPAVESIDKYKNNWDILRDYIRIK